jgi:hypothetical protein
LFNSLETIIRHKFIPALLGGRHVSETERNLLALPARRGGIAVEDPTYSSDEKHKISLTVTKALSELILSQNINTTVNKTMQQAVKSAILKETDIKQQERTNEVVGALTPNLQRAVMIAQEKGASSFLSTLPLERYGFTLSKSEFRDAVFLRYMWPLPNLPSRCVCGKSFTIDHAQMCHMGGFINMRHDAIRDILAAEMRDIFRDVEIEPLLTPLSGEVILPASANREPDARADIRARSFWTDQQSAYFDIRVFYPHAPSYLSRSVSGLCKTFEAEKRRHYGDRILHVENGSFTPLIFSSCGGMGQEAISAVKKLASMAAEKRKESYHHTITLLRLRLQFSLVRSALVCIRGTRRSSKSLALLTHIPADAVLHELRADM